MKLGMEVGLGPGRIVLDEDPDPPKGAQPPIFGQVCCDQTAVWIKVPLGTEVCLGTGRHCVRCGPSSPPPKGAQQQPPLFGPCLLWPNGRPSHLLLSSCLHFLTNSV